MNRHKFILGSVLCLGVFASGIAIGQDDAMWHRHPNLAEASRLIHQASDRIDAAQAANHLQLGGHGDRAKDLLAQADREIRAAAFAADHP